MKVKFTTERNCCSYQYDDFLPYKGQSNIPAALRPKFCKHCGQLWYLSRFTDAAGSSDSEYVRCIPSHHDKKITAGASDSMSIIEMARRFDETVSLSGSGVNTR